MDTAVSTWSRNLLDEAEKKLNSAKFLFQEIFHTSVRVCKINKIRKLIGA